MKAAALRPTELGIVIVSQQFRINTSGPQSFSSIILPLRGTRKEVVYDRESNTTMYCISFYSWLIHPSGTSPNTNAEGRRACIRMLLRLTLTSSTSARLDLLLTTYLIAEHILWPFRTGLSGWENSRHSTWIHNISGCHAYIISSNVCLPFRRAAVETENTFCYPLKIWTSPAAYAEMLPDYTIKGLRPIGLRISNNAGFYLEAWWDNGAPGWGCTTRVNDSGFTVRPATTYGIPTHNYNRLGHHLTTALHIQHALQSLSWYSEMFPALRSTDYWWFFKLLPYQYTVPSYFFTWT